MTELDFDELDRAVNSLIGGKTQTSDSPTPANNAVVSNTTPNTNSVAVNVTSSIKPTEPAVSTPVTPLTAFTEKRQGGRFMDVVHPSSDMKTASNEVPARDAIVVAPREPVITDNNSVEPPAPEKAWPDPIDFNNHDSSTAPVVEPQPTPRSEPVELPTLPTVEPVKSPEINHEADITGTLNSPFLSNAKVEKRPLGAFSVEDEVKPVSPEVETKPVVTTPASKVDDSIDLAPIGHDETDTPLPAELQENLLSIEADTTTQQGPPSTSRDSDEQQPITSSITQQYTAGKSSNTDKQGAIYDTKVYNKALKGPAKKKSSWWMVLWIALLLIVGTAAGAAVYYFVLPAL